MRKAGAKFLWIMVGWTMLTVILFFMWAFTYASMDATTWPADSRGGLAATWFIFSGIWFFIVLCNDFPGERKPYVY